jgi:site-specific DNA recombinase
MPKKVALYIRVSTQEQVQEGYSIDAQTERLHAYCTAKDWIIFGTYTDAGFSGSNTKRPELQRLLNDVRAGLVDCVLVYKLDRLSRSQKDTLMLIEDEFLSRDVAFVSMSENFDTSTPLGRAMVGILSVFAQLEREQIKERMAMGRAERAKNGFFHGGGFAPFGYTYSDGLLHVDPVKAEIVKEVFDLFLQRTPITTIEDHLSKKYGRTLKDATVRSILSTRTYTGVISWEGKKYEGRHEAIIDTATFERAQRLLNDRRRIAESRPEPFKPKHLLSGLLYCANCGARYFAKGCYSGHGSKKKYRPYYACYSRAKTNKQRIVDPFCKNPNYACVDLDAHVINEIVRLANDQKAFKAVVGAKKLKKASANDKKTGVLLQRIDEIDAQIHRVLDLYQLGSINIDEIKERIAELEMERDALSTQLEDNKAETTTLLPPAKAHSLLDDFVCLSESKDIHAMRDIIFELIQRIDVLPEKGQLQIIWNF